MDKLSDSFVDETQKSEATWAQLYDSRPWQKYYDAGVPKSLDYPSMPAFSILEEVAQKFPEGVCLHYRGHALTNHETNQLSDRLAAGFYKLGIRKGERVSLLMPNMAQFVLAYFAALKIGAVVVAVNPLYSPREVEHQVNNSGSVVMVVHHRYYPMVKGLQTQTGLRQLIVVEPEDIFQSIESEANPRAPLAEGDEYFSNLIAQNLPENRPMVDVNPEDVALLQYTGGTTGVPKGAVVLHRNLVANTLQLYRWTSVALEEGKESLVLAIPLCHIYGMVCGMLLAIRGACTIILLEDPRDLNAIMLSIQDYQATFFHGVPTLFNAINNHSDVQAGKFNLTSLKRCNSGSAPLMKDTKDRFEALTGASLTDGYGLSEAPTCTHTNPFLENNRTGDGSFGVPIQDTDARVVSLEDGVTILPPGEIGELIVRGPQISSGYHNMPEETASTYRDGWLYTGDIVRMDSQGYFFFIDRKKELIKPGGYQVWPREVEEIIANHPAVLEVAVGGIPDPYRGESVKAWVVLKPGQTMSVDEIRAWCKKDLAPFKVPTQVEFRESLPKTHVGKILRRELVREHNEQEKPQ